MLIRKMTFDDIAQAVEIEKQCFSDPWSEKSFEDSLARDDTLFLVCIEEATESEVLKENKIVDTSSYLTNKEYMDQTVGYIGMYISYDEGNITNVAVASAYRKKGYGEALLLAAKENAKEKEVEKIFLEVRVSNEPAISLYKKMKFEKLGVRKNFYDDPKEDAYIMSCDLKDC